MESTKNKNLQLYFDLLPRYDREEVRSNVPSIYYTCVGLNNLPSCRDKPIECDDEYGYFKVSLSSHINFRYEVISPLGKGGYAEVFAVFDHKKKWSAALKILRNIKYLPGNYEDEIYKLEILNKQSTKSLIMHDYFIFRDHPCIVLDLLDVSLCDALIRRRGTGYNVAEIREIIKSLLCGLLELKKVNMVHCDLKPDNVVFVKEGELEVKIIDFGHSIFLNTNNKYIQVSMLTQTQLQVRQYRAPEIFLLIPFGLPIDMWCVGVIAVELFTARNLFNPVREEDQLTYIAQVIGVPPKSVLHRSAVARQYFEDDGYPKYYGEKLKRKLNFEDAIIRGPPSSSDLSIILDKSRSQKYIDFVKKCLTWDPDDRITVEQALEHPWFIKDTSLQDASVLDRSIQNTTVGNLIKYNSQQKHFSY